MEIILSALMGGGLGLIPMLIKGLFGIWQDWIDKKHEYRMGELQLQVNKTIVEGKLEEIRLNNSRIENIQDIDIRYKTFNTGSKWIDLINNIGRVLLAFMIMGLYCAVTFMYFDIISKYLAVNKNNHLAMLQQLWTTEDYKLFAYIIGFFFSSHVSSSK